MMKMKKYLLVRGIDFKKIRVEAVIDVDRAYPFKPPSFMYMKLILIKR